MDVASIEAALIDAIKAGCPAVDTVERYAGQLEQEIEELPFGTSAIFVMYDGSALVRADNQSFIENLMITTVVACRNLACRADAQVDAYALLQSLRGLLANQNLGLEIDPLTPERVELVFVSGALCVYGIRWATAFDSITAPA